MSSVGDSEVLTSPRRSRLSLSESLPQMFVEKERMDGLRYRHSSSSTPESSPPTTSTPTVNMGYLGQQFHHTPVKDKSLAVNIDSGYGGFNTTRKKFVSNPDGSYISSPLVDLAELVTSPVREMRRRWRGRQSFLEPGHTRLGGAAAKLVRQVEPHQVLAWLMVSVVLTSLGFALLVSLRQDRRNSKYRSIQFGNEKLSERMRNEGKLGESVNDENRIGTGGEKADHDFDKLAEIDTLDKEGAPLEKVKDFYNDLDDNISKVQKNTNQNPLEGGDVLPEAPLSASKESDLRNIFPDEDSKQKRKMKIKSKFKSYRPPSVGPGNAPQPRTGKVLFKVKDASTDPELEVKDASTDPELEVKDASTDPELEVKDGSTDPESEVKDDAITDSKQKSPSPPVAVVDASNVTKPELEDSLSSDIINNSDKEDVLASAAADQKTYLETSPDELKGALLKTETRSASRRRTKFRNPLLKQSYKNKMSKAKKSKELLTKTQIISADYDNDSNMNYKLGKYQGPGVEEKKAPVLNFPGDLTFRKENTWEVDSVKGESQK